MKTTHFISRVAGWGLATCSAFMLLPAHAQRAAQVRAWVTTPDQAQLLRPQPGTLRFGPTPPAGTTIEIDDSQTFQTMDGFGYCLTGAAPSCCTP